MRKEEPIVDLETVTSELHAYDPLANLAEVAAKTGCRVTLTIDINPPEATGTEYESSETRRWQRNA